jgi:hypothetical protein
VQAAAQIDVQQPEKQKEHISCLVIRLSLQLHSRSSAVGASFPGRTS